MSEHRRNDKYQFCDVELAVVVDTITGETYRFSETIGTLADALDHLEMLGGSQSRAVVVKLSCVKAFKIE